MISILLPTRKRPNNVTRLVDSITSTVSDIQNVELIVYIDDDDEESIPALSAAAEKINVNAVQGNRIVGSQMYNEMFKLAQGDILMYAADDIVFKTPKWNLLVQETFNLHEDKILLVYGDDGFQKEKLATHGFIHRYWVEILGYLFPPQFASTYVDQWVTEVADKIKRRYYLPNLLIEHLHPTNGKAPMDDIYKNRLELSGDISKFYNSLEPLRVQDSQKIQAFIDLFK